MPSSFPSPLKIAIVGAGPGGLGAAIAFSELPDVQLQVFEQATELREVGAGISIQPNTWRVLRLFKGADQDIPGWDRKADTTIVDGQHRNGRTNELLSKKHETDSGDVPPYIRVERHVLQKALLNRVPPGLIQLKKRLAKIEESDDGTRLSFQDGTVAGPFDLLIGADGLRSVVRQYAHPDHRLSYTGKIAYRVIIPDSKVAHIPDIPRHSTFWHTRDTHVYTSFLPNGKFEIATRAVESDELGQKVSWGQVASKQQVVPHYAGYSEKIRAIIDAPDSWLQFAMFGGPRLESVVHDGRIALIGDASHPLSGAFGSGAGFALEDAYTLKSAVQYARGEGKSLAYALELFDTARSPHYKRLYGVLDSYAAVARELRSAEPPLSDDDLVESTIRRNWELGGTGWIYAYNVVDVWKQRIREEDAKTLAALPHIADRVPKLRDERPVCLSILVPAEV